MFSSVVVDSPRSSGSSENSVDPFSSVIESDVVTLMSMVEIPIPLKEKFLSSLQFIFIPLIVVIIILLIPLQDGITPGTNKIPHILNCTLVIVPFYLYLVSLIASSRTKKIPILMRIIFASIIVVSGAIFIFIAVDNEIPVPYAAVITPTVLIFQLFTSFTSAWETKKSLILFINVFFGLINFTLLILCLLLKALDSIDNLPGRIIFLFFSPFIDFILTFSLSFLFTFVKLTPAYLYTLPLSSIICSFHFLFFFCKATTPYEMAALISGLAIQIPCNSIKVTNFAFYYFVKTDYHPDRDLMKIQYHCNAFATFYFSIVAHALTSVSNLVCFAFVRYGWNLDHYTKLFDIPSHIFIYRFIPSIVVYIIILGLILKLTVFLLNRRGGLEKRYITPLPRRLLLKYKWMVLGTVSMGVIINFTIALKDNGVSSFVS